MICLPSSKHFYSSSKKRSQSCYIQVAVVCISYIAKDVCFLLHVYDYYDGIFLEYWSNKSGGKVWESGDGISIAYTRMCFFKK